MLGIQIWVVPNPMAAQMTTHSAQHAVLVQPTHTVTAKYTYNKQLVQLLLVPQQRDTWYSAAKAFAAKLLQSSLGVIKP